MKCHCSMGARIPFNPPHLQLKGSQVEGDMKALNRRSWEGAANRNRPY